MRQTTQCSGGGGKSAVRRPGLGGLAFALALLIVTAACATRQPVSLAIEPAPIELYVDGRLVAEGDPSSIELSPERGHVLLIRRRGYHSEQVVLESVARDGRRRLEPERIELRLRPESPTGRALDVELEGEDASDPVPGGGSGR